jgi:hypothetical protein
MAKNMASALLLLALLQPSRDDVVKLAEGLPETRPHLIALGPSALRYLADLPRTPALSDVMFEMKCAGLDAALRERLTRECDLKTAPFVLAEADERWGALLGVPVIVDFGLLPEKRNREVAFSPGTPDRMLRTVLEPAGLDYAVVRGRLVVTTPERLWSLPQGRIRPLDDDERKRLDELVRAIADDDAVARGEARAALINIGPSALPYLEQLLRTEPLEPARRAQVVDVMRVITARQRPAPFARPLALERQETSDVDRVTLRSLREKSTKLSQETTLAGALAMIAGAAGLDIQPREEWTRERRRYVLPAMPVIDALYYVLASHDLDAALIRGRLRLGTTEEVERELRNR